MKHVARRWRQPARPDGDRQQHDVHHGEGGDAQRAQQASLLVRLDSASDLGRKRPCGEAEFVEALHDETRLHRALVPFYRHALAGEIHARAANASLGLQPPLDGRHATATVDALNHKIHGCDAARGMTNENREIRFDAHGAVSAPDPRRRPTRLRVS